MEGDLDLLPLMGQKMKLMSTYLLVLVVVVLLFSSSVVGSASSVVKSIFVDLAGHRDFKSIQDAVDSVPSNNNQWIRIHLVAGVYIEKVNIPKDKGFIYLEGEGCQQTVIQWGDHAVTTTNNGTSWSATFTSSPDNFVAKGITFKNTYRSNQTNQAAAAIIQGDKSSFYSCRFIGFQDTLADLFGRHYYRDCYIEGAIDFIFGYALTIYESCTISTQATTGWLTAQGKAHALDRSGFVFKSCNVTGSGKTYLGRAWGTYSTVVFYNTFMSDVVVPQGWDAWTATGNERCTFYAEYDCYGPGSATSSRVSWEKKLIGDEVMKYVDISFIDIEGWLSQQPQVAWK